MCSEMKLQLQGLEIQQNFYLFDLHGVDSVQVGTVRGIAEIKANFNELIKKWCLEGINLSRGFCFSSSNGKDDEGVTAQVFNKLFLWPN